MRIFVTGDVHIGLKYADHPARETLVRERTDVLARMVAKANDEGCELFAVTGDLFENQRVAEAQVKAAADALGAFRGTVVVLPGNHDYYDNEAAVWKTFRKHSEKWDNIALLAEYKPYFLPELFGKGAVIYPAFCDREHSDKNRLDRIKALLSEDADNADILRIGMAHGAVAGETIDSEGYYFPMTREELAALPMDVWLIGHTHVPFPRNLAEDFAPTDERIFNPGAPAQVSSQNNTEGSCFILELDERKNLRAKRFVSGNIRLYRAEVALSAGNMERELFASVSSFNNNSSVTLNLSGAVSDEEFDSLREVLDKLGSRFIEFSYESSVTPLITREKIMRDFPSELSFARDFLLELLDDPNCGQTEAQLAYELLKLRR